MGAWDQDDVLDKDSNLFGLAVLGEKWVGTVDSAKWKTDAKVNNGETLFLELVVDTGNPNPDFNPLTISYKNGSKFETNDGRTIEPLVKGTKVHPNSGFGKLLEATFKLPEAIDAMQAQADTPLDAAAWEGLTFTWGVGTTDYKGDIGTIDRWIPIAFGGDMASVDGSSGGNSEPRDREELEAELTELAKASDDADAFLAKAMEVDGFTDHDDLVSGYKKFYRAANK